jgi:hypothetical protein
MNAYQREAVLRHVLWPLVTFQHEDWHEVLGVSPRDTVHVARALGFSEEEISAALTPSGSVSTLPLSSRYA